jgi:hypothetical protein
MKRFFASLPLAALVENSTLILHGGLFRAPPAKAKAGGKRRRSTGGGAFQCRVCVFVMPARISSSSASLVQLTDCSAAADWQWQSHVMCLFHPAQV